MKLTCKISIILLWVKKNEQLKDKEASESTFQAVKTVQEPIGYLMIINKLCLSNQSIQHPIQFLCLETRILYNTIQHANENTNDYLVRFCNS